MDAGRQECRKKKVQAGLPGFRVPLGAA